MAFLNAEKIVAITRVRHEEDIIFDSLSNLRRLGITKFLICDNNSLDNTVVEIRRFMESAAESTVLILSDPRKNMERDNQSSVLNALAAYAVREFNPHWILPFDADDWLFMAPNYSVDLSLIDADYIQLDWLHIHPRQFVGHSLPEFIARESLTGVRSLVGKVMFRPKGDVIIETGQHRVYSSKGRVVSGVRGSDVGIAFAHFPVRSKEKFSKKILNMSNKKRVFDIWNTDNTGVDNAAERLIEGLWSGDKERFSDLCRELGKDPAKFNYMYDLFIGQIQTTFSPAAYSNEMAAKLRRIYAVGARDPWHSHARPTKLQRFKVSLLRAFGRLKGALR